MRVFKGVVKTSSTLLSFLIERSQLPEVEVKLGSERGAVWLQKGGKGRILKCREPGTTLTAGDSVQFFYDPKVLHLPPAQGCYSVYESAHYGCWYKPAGVLSQGSQAGDHTSLLRVVELAKKQDIYLIHRLDRETAGLVLLAYNPKAAAHLSEMFQKHQIKKVYEAIVKGEVSGSGTISAALDDKEAITHFKVLKTAGGYSLLEVTIETGRLHQIRRHLDHINHPVMGDPKYGKGNKNREGLKLLARSLAFTDPWTKLNMSLTLPDGLSL